MKLNFKICIFLSTILLADKVFGNLEICESEGTLKDNEFICNQDKVYDSLLSNPLSFILFYIFSIVLIAFFFQLSQRNKNKKK